VTGKPESPGALLFAYFKGQAPTMDCLAVPAAAQRPFPRIKRILHERLVLGGTLIG
jgi:hypothetical protein